MSQDWRLTVIGAYGRDYETAEAAVKDWNAGKDFYIMTPGNPSYINNADAKQFGVPENFVRIRFNKKTDFVDVDVNTGRALRVSDEDNPPDDVEPSGQARELWTMRDPDAPALSDDIP